MATSEDRTVVVSHGQIAFEADWSDVKGYKTGEMELPYYDELRYAIQLSTGH